MKVTVQANTVLEMIAIERLQSSPTNPRKAFDVAELAELKASIAASGVQVPLLVRMLGLHPSSTPVYEIVAGERRYRAARALGMKELPCLVRELTDEQVREAQIIENLQRAGVHPLEEAKAFEELQGRLRSIAAVAAAVSKEQAYVAKCLRLLRLTEQSRTSLLGGLITIEHALLLARLAEREQNDALKWTLDRNAGSKTARTGMPVGDSSRQAPRPSAVRAVGYDAMRAMVEQNLAELRARLDEVREEIEVLAGDRLRMEEVDRKLVAQEEQQLALAAALHPFCAPQAPEQGVQFEEAMA